MNDPRTVNATPLDFDNELPDYSDDCEWWREQDAEMCREEFELLDIQAEIEEYRREGYGL